MSREPRTRTPLSRRPHPTPSRPAVHPAQTRSASARHQLSRHEREQHYQRLTLIGAGLIVAVVLALLGAGWYSSYVKPYRQTVITVGAMHADMRYFIKRVKEVIPQFANNDPQVVIGAAPEAARQEIETEFIVLQRAPAAGVTVSQQDIDNQIARQLGVLTVNGTAPDRAAIEAGLRNKLTELGMSVDEYRQEIRAQLMAQKLSAKLGADYPKVGPAAKYQEMIFNKQDDAKNALDRLNNGTDWDAVAADVRKSPTTGTVAEYDFQPKLQVDDKLADALFALKDGQHTDVVPTADGKFGVARLVQKDDNHQLSDEQLTAISPKLFSNWLDEQRKSIRLKDNLSDDQKLFAVVQSGYQPKATPSQSVPSGPAGAPPGFSTPAGGLVQPSPPTSGTPGP